MEKIEQIKQYLLEQIELLKEEVEEAFDDRDGLYDGRYDFGHSQDSFEAGWDRGEKVGMDYALSLVLKEIDKL